MKKPNSSIKARKASIKRGKKRTDRLKKTQEDKALRKSMVKKNKSSQEKKFQNYLNNLMPPEGQ